MKYMFFRQKYKKTKKTKNKTLTDEIEEIKHNNKILNKDGSFIKMLIKKRLDIKISGAFYHIASLVPDIKKNDWLLGKIAIGENSERPRFGNNISTHAEINALYKYYDLIRTKKCKIEAMNLIVIRVNKTGSLCESAPCYHCTKELLKSMIPINYVCFSRADGTISCFKFLEWIQKTDHHVSKGWCR